MSVRVVKKEEKNHHREEVLKIWANSLDGDLEVGGDSMFQAMYKRLLDLQLFLF